VWGRALCIVSLPTLSAEHETDLAGIHRWMAFESQAAHRTGSSTDVLARLDPAVFHLPVQKIREGWYSDAYFNLTKELLEAEHRRVHVTVQVFQRHRSLLGGVDEAIAILKECAGRRNPDDSWALGWRELQVEALREGTQIEPYETVLKIEGDYSLFAHLETVYLGCLARRTLIMRNVREVVQAADGKEILFFPARHDHWLVQTGDGWAAHVAGAIGVSTDAQASWWGGRGVGTVPHGLIAAYRGDTVAAARAFAARFADRMNVTVLVDFDNDSVSTALAVAGELGERLWGVRLDTSGTLVDRSILARMESEGDFDPTGVNVGLARIVRGALDDAGHKEVKIVVSGGFDATKIRAFEQAGAPVDAYGVGSALVRGENDFTADVVLVEGRPAAKRGRRWRPNPRLEPVL
jgi:nicotinate phosphoribosyltransferase